MKTVFNNSQLAHVWASQSQDHGKNAGGSMFFSGVDIYSYGHHYLAARIYPNNVVLVNNYVYSNSTAKHLRDIRSAVSHLKSFSVSNPADPKQSILDSANSIADQYVKLFSCVKSFYLESFLGALEDHNELCEIFKQPKQKMNFPVEMINDLKAYNKILEARELPRKLEREKQAEIARLQREEQAKIDLEAWKHGGPHTYKISSIRPMLIRVKGDVVETSGGAEVPLFQARRLLTMILNKMNVVGKKIGPFEVDALNESIIKIGCHEIDINHAKQVLAESIGV